MVRACVCTRDNVDEEREQKEEREKKEVETRPSASIHIRFVHTQYSLMMRTAAATARTMLATTKRSHSNRNGESVWKSCATLDGVRFWHTLMGQPKIIRPSHNFYIFSPTCRRRRQRRREEKKENNERNGTKTTLATWWIRTFYISLPNTVLHTYVSCGARGKHRMINRRMLGRIFVVRGDEIYDVRTKWICAGVASRMHATTAIILLFEFVLMCSWMEKAVK